MPDATRVKYFIELCRQGSYTKAAECLYISQPALSRHIRLLEQELGVNLIKHQQKKFQLTSEGRSFLKLATEFRQQEKRFELASQNLKTRFSSVLRVGFSEDLSISRLLFVEESMTKKYPNLLIEFTSFSQQAQILPELLKGSIDVALAFRSELGQVAWLNYENVAENYIAIILSKRHRFWGKQSVTLEELRREKIFVPIQELSPGSFNAAINFLQKFDIYLQGNCFDRSIEEQLLRVSKGGCVSLSHMYGSDLIHCASDSFSRIPILGSNIHSGDLTLAYRDDTQEIVDLIDFFRQAFSPIMVSE